MQHAGGSSRNIEVGNEPPLVGAGRRRAPDRREVSLRWLSGTALTGLTSTILMGAALFAALDGRDLRPVDLRVEVLRLQDANGIPVAISAFLTLGTRPTIGRLSQVIGRQPYHVCSTVGPT